ncbi:hypothetical protein J2S43_005584 [Catenuloplanes nepalensis]|uniref:Signal transduction histidine kinase dimerisation/phosphoacceptor domain-containing protein n=1 Tax=Catenuloplanes nepalensis TaxID=587533 RepID=A0ABT9N053_9ACTN|nr:hypothetical protein [Catenuloplanes nepalensis]MDP9797072.1 hypothetical protein [Catenuloplanes nepalensis]
MAEPHPPSGHLQRDAKSGHHAEGLADEVRQGTHDLANLLGIAANYLQFLEEDLDGVAGVDDARGHLERIIAAVDRATEVTRRLAAAAVTPS